MAQLVIDVHDAARRGEKTDPGVAAALRMIGNGLSVLISDMQRLLATEMDSDWTDLGEN